MSFLSFDLPLFSFNSLLGFDVVTDTDTIFEREVSTRLTHRSPLSAVCLSPTHMSWATRGRSGIQETDEGHGSGILIIATPLSHQTREAFRIGCAGLQAAQLGDQIFNLKAIDVTTV